MKKILILIFVLTIFSASLAQTKNANGKPLRYEDGEQVALIQAVGKYFSIEYVYTVGYPNYCSKHGVYLRPLSTKFLEINSELRLAAEKQGEKIKLSRETVRSNPLFLKEVEKQIDGEMAKLAKKGLSPTAACNAFNDSTRSNEFLKEINFKNNDPELAPLFK